MSPLNNTNINNKDKPEIVVKELHEPEEYSSAKNYLTICLIFGIVFLLYSIIFLIKMVIEGL